MREFLPSKITAGGARFVLRMLHQIEQSAREIRQIELLFHQPDLSSESESSNMSENEVCRRVIPHNDMDLSDQEGFMSEDSGSE